MSTAKSILIEEMDRQGDRRESDDRSAPNVIINRNGSRYVSPIDIVRSAAGRREILRQRTHQRGTKKTFKGATG
jgi:hypothetical protein